MHGSQCKFNPVMGMMLVLCWSGGHVGHLNPKFWLVFQRVCGYTDCTFNGMQADRL